MTTVKTISKSNTRLNGAWFRIKKYGWLIALMTGIGIAMGYMGKALPGQSWFNAVFLALLTSIILFINGYFGITDRMGKFWWAKTVIAVLFLLYLLTFLMPRR